MDPTATLSPERLLRRLEWRVVRRLDGLLQGDYRSLFRGVGIDFTDLREYEPGDDLRHIEWNVTARLDTPFVREYVEDREITSWLLLDLSPSMAFGPVARQKGLVVAKVAACGRVRPRGEFPFSLSGQSIARSVQVIGRKDDSVFRHDDVRVDPLFSRDAGLPAQPVAVTRCVVPTDGDLRTVRRPRILPIARRVSKARRLGLPHRGVLGYGRQEACVVLVGHLRRGDRERPGDPHSVLDFIWRASPLGRRGPHEEIRASDHHHDVAVRRCIGRQRRPLLRRDRRETGYEE